MKNSIMFTSQYWGISGEKTKAKIKGLGTKSNRELHAGSIDLPQEF